VTGIINLGTGRARSVQEIVDVLRHHFPSMEVHSVESDIPFEASQADMTKYTTHIGWTPVYTLETAIPEIIAFEEGKLDATENSSESIPMVLVSSASRKIPLVRAMRQAVLKLHPDAKIIAGDCSPFALAAHVADGFWCMPPTSDDNLHEIIRGCKQRGINTVLPTRDGELLFWARHSNVFAKCGIAVMTSSEEAVSLCLDKLAFAAFGKRNALPFISTEVDADAVAGERLVVKERFGAGARAIGLNLSKEAARLHAKTLREPIFQPYLTGNEISIDAWLYESHQVKGLVLRRREVLLNGESQVTTTFRRPDFEVQAIRVLQALKLSGPVVLQAIITADKHLQVIECNARFGGASTTAIEAGLDSLYWSLLEANGVNVFDYVFARIPGELRQVRVPSDLYFNVDGSCL
jgi:carbamoyl-phosphate synthase large subunit